MILSVWAYQIRTIVIIIIKMINCHVILCILLHFVLMLIVIELFN